MATFFMGGRLLGGYVKFSIVFTPHIATLKIRQFYIKKFFILKGLQILNRINYVSA